MKQQTFRRHLWLLLLLTLIPLGTWADNVVNQLQFGKQTITVAADEEITFYDFMGDADIASSSANNSQSLTVFQPAVAGMSIQITYSMIDILPDMSSGSYPTYMKVYSGTPDDSGFTWATSASQVNKNSTLPEGDVLVTRGGMVASEGYTSESPETYVSRAADGSMAVGFIYVYAKACRGWKATVKCVTLENMTITGAGSNYDGIGGPQTGKTNVPLANAFVTATGALNPDNVTGIWFTMTKNEDAMDPLALKLFKGNTQLDATVSADGNGYKFTLNESPVDGTTNFTLKGDFLGTAAVGAKVQVDVTKIASVGQPNGITPFTAGTSVEVENPAVECMTAGDHGTISLGLGQSLSIYDDGGPNADGADGVDATITIAPTGEAQSIRLTDMGFTFNYSAHLYIYEGTAVDDTHLLKDVTGSSAKFDPIIVDGPVTLKYVGRGSYTKPNFAVLAEGYKKADVTILGVTAEDISISEVLKGQTDVKMLKIAVEAEGELTPATITAFNVTADGQAAAAQHIYQTGTVASFSPTEEFNGSYDVTQTGTYYFWLTIDVDAEATVGQTASTTLNSIVVNGSTIDVTTPVTATITVASGKSGDYTVGQGGNYATIQAAVDDLGTLGMDGPVTLKVKAGEYNEKVRVPYIRGMGAVNTLTIESESGQRDVKIYHNVYFSGGYSDDEGSKAHGVVTLYEAQYVTLRNLEVTTTDLGYDAVVMVKNESRHCTIDNCYIHAVTSSEIQQDLNLIGHYAQNIENKNNDFLTVKDCLLEGGYIGVNMGGTGYVALPKEVGGIVEGNTFKNQGSKSIYVQDELGAKIRNNTVIIEATADTKMSTGIMDVQLRDEYSEAVEITGNTFNVAPNYYTTAVYLRDMEGTSAAPVVIANNVVNMASLSGSYCAVKFSTAKVKNVNMAYNTFRMTGDNGGVTFALSKKFDAGYGEGINVVNNIIQNETSGYAVNLYNDDNLTKMTFQNNVMSTACENFFRGAAETEGDFAAFVTATGATNCINKTVTFLSEEVLEPANDLEGDLTTAQALDYVTTDITGKDRPAENATIGAYEYDATAQSAPVMAEGYPKVLTHLDGKATFSVKTDIAATVYYVVQKSSAIAPTASALENVETKKDVAANTETTIEVTGLEDEEEYIAFFLPVSLRGIPAETVSYTEPFTMEVTPPETDEPEAEVYINNSDTEEAVEAGSTVTLMAMVTVDERTAPYTLTWMDSKHNVLLTETYESADDIDVLFTATDTPTECTDYIFTVEDAAGKSATATVRAIVLGDAVTATFENLYLAENSWEKGENLPLGSFVSGSYKFDNGAMPDWNYYYDFMYSNSTATTFASYVTDQWNNCVGGGYNGSENFVVAYPQGGKITVLNNPEGDVIRGFYITNSAWTVDNIVNGDGMSSDGGAPFGEGDYFKVIITADNGNSIDFYLADYRSANAADRYYVNTWEWVDLTSLGTVKYLTFTFDGTKRNSYGLTTATYFCMDDFNGTAPETAEPLAEVYINNSETEETVEPGTAVTLMAMVTVDEHAAPYTLTWMDSKHNVLKTETFESADDIDALFTTTATPTECTDYIFTVEDAAGKSATATVRAILTGDAITATFENLYLAENSWEKGVNLPLGSFVSGSYKFDNGAIPDWDYYYDFMYSNSTATTFASYVTDQWNNCVGSGFNGSENFVVAYPQGGKITVLNNPEGDVIRGFYITNSAWTVDNIVNGDGMSDDGGTPFGEGDYFKLIITADNGNSVDFYLADFRSTDAAERYYVNTWEWVDLTSLGTVKYLTFSFDGTKKNSYGLTTATYFCMDDFNGTAPTDVKGLTPALSQEEGAWYDLSGRRVKTPGKGIYIHNGKRVLMK